MKRIKEWEENENIEKNEKYGGKIKLKNISINGILNEWCKKMNKIRKN